MSTRRQFIKKTGLLLAVGTGSSAFQNAIASSDRSDFTSQTKLQFGIASHSLRHFNFDEMLNMVNRVGINRIAVKSVHVPLVGGNLRRCP